MVTSYKNYVTFLIEDVTLIFYKHSTLYCNNVVTKNTNRMSVFVNPLKSTKAKLKEEKVLLIAIHKKVAIQLEAAANRHLEASKHNEDGDDELACLSSIAAIKLTELAIETQKKLIK